MKRTVFAEFIWIDGCEPTPNLRSKTKVIALDRLGLVQLSDFPQWTFDGSSTNQADGHKSDVILGPVRFCQDPTRSDESYLVLCETFNADGSANRTNYREHLAEILNKYAVLQPWIGLEQEYFLMKGDHPIGWVDKNCPPVQGDFYCGIGGKKVAGREIVEKHLSVCSNIGLGITGINAEVALGQWEFQIFGKDLLEAADHLWLSRYLLGRIAEQHGCDVEYHPKPFRGDCNGSGMHTNFSTKEMREGSGGENGMFFIEKACQELGKHIPEHLACYGADNDLRLTGKHETCSIHDFKYGVSDRGASIRIPLQVAQTGFGYFEDRRPAANADPYRVAAVMLETVGLALTGSTNFSSYQDILATVSKGDEKMLDLAKELAEIKK